MKKIILSLLLLSSSICMAQNVKRPLATIPLVFHVNFHTSWDDPTETTPGYPRAPMLMPDISYYGHILYFDGLHPAFTLTLMSDDSVIYQTYVDATDGSLTLPSDLSGDYELQLSSSDDFYYYAEITLS